MLLTNKLLTSLKMLYSDNGPERGGYIDKENNFIEVENIFDSPNSAFLFSYEDEDRLSENGTATVHTHPNASSNLSKDDYDTFLNWWSLYHLIVGKDGITCYKISESGSVVKEEINVCES